MGWTFSLSLLTSVAGEVVYFRQFRVWENEEACVAAYTFRLPWGPSSPVDALYLILCSRMDLFYILLWIV